VGGFVGILAGGRVGDALVEHGILAGRLQPRGRAEGVRVIAGVGAQAAAPVVIGLLSMDLGEQSEVVDDA
jgi:hypothetical protein